MFFYAFIVFDYTCNKKLKVKEDLLNASNNANIASIIPMTNMASTVATRSENEENEEKERISKGKRRVQDSTLARIKIISETLPIEEEVSV